MTLAAFPCLIISLSYHRGTRHMTLAKDYIPFLVIQLPGSQGRTPLPGLFLASKHSYSSPVLLESSPSCPKARFLVSSLPFVIL
jgi:hypothetical protein